MDEFGEPETSTRRGLLHAFARTAARGARERANLINLAGLDSEPAGEAASIWTAPQRHTARAPVRAVPLDELLALAHEEGLTRHDGALRALARRSLRMTPIEAGSADAWIRTADDQPAAGGEVLQALIDLAAISGHGCALPTNGWLALFVALSEQPADAEARRAHGVLLDMPAAVSDAEPVAARPELVIPRRWHEAVQALDLDDTEAEAYDRLRTLLQGVQGVETDADGGPLVAYHRLFGYPNETTGAMPRDCARALDGGSLGPEPDPADLALPSRAWQLLAQVSVGDRRRAYVWIRQNDLEVGEFERLCAFVR